VKSIRLTAVAAGLLVVGLWSAPGATLPSHFTAQAASLARTAAVVTNGAWPVYHHDNAHTGFDSSAASASTATAGWVSTTFDAQVYASPLVYQGVVYVATLNNTVYALNQADGTVLWSKHLGAPTTSGWVCGNVSPQGILGTPVVDTTSNRIYVAAFLSTHVWTIFGLDLANLGNVVLTTMIPGNFAAGAFDWKIEQERGALAVANGTVYVPFGGRAGDCNDNTVTPNIVYQGWVIGVPTSGSTSLTQWHTGGSGGAGIWSAGGVVVDDSTGKVFVTTGNGGCPPTYDNFNDAVVRLSAALTLEDYFAPQDWHDHWNCNDQDLGSSSTVLLNPSLAFQSGKRGGGFLVNPKSLGGIDGQLYPTPSPQAYSEVNVCVGNSADANFGSYSYAAPYVYLSCESNGLVALNVDTTAPSFSGCGTVCGAPSWNAGGFHPGPPIVAGGVVWAADINGGGLYGFNAATGAPVYHSAAFAVNHFTTPAEAGGQLFVSAGTVVREFDMVKACTGAVLAANPASPQAAGTPVMLTGSVSNCPSPLYRFWVQPPGGPWGIARDYSSSPTFNWTTTGTGGLYHLEVDVRDSGSTAAYDSVANTTYTITGSAACATAGLGASPASPQLPGTQVTWTGSSSGCPNPRYRFWESDPGSPWTIVQDYSPTATHTWNSPMTAGSYRFEVDVRDVSEAAAYDVVANSTFVLQPAPACTSAGLSMSPPSPGASGVAVTLTGTSATCPNPQYRFWVRDPGRRWSMVQDYGAATTHLWSQTGLVGSYGVEVDVRDASETTVYDVVANGVYMVNGCSAAGLTANPPNTAAHGTTITLTGSSTCPATPTYRFCIRAPGGAWQVVQDYGTGNAFMWTPATAGSYSLEVDVRDQNATDSYEKVANITYLVS